MNRGMFPVIGSPLTMAGITSGLAPYLANHLGGLELSTAGSSATFAVAVGGATDSTNADFMKLTSALSKTTGAWAPGTGGGALDTGAIATSTWYHCFLIKRPDSVAPDVLTSLSPTAPTMPQNFTLKRRIGAMKTDGSSQWTAFTQRGDVFTWIAPALDINNAASSLTRVNVTLTVPTGIVVNALFRGNANPNGVTAHSVLFTALTDTDETPSNTNGISDLTGDAARGFPGNFARFTDTSARIGQRSESATLTYTIRTYGWIDTRGK